MTMTTETVRERPVLFSGPMVRAILEGRKAQTRRVVKGAPEDAGCAVFAANWQARDINDALFFEGTTPQSRGLATIRCPYGRPGDRLWLREAHHLTTTQAVIYRADYPQNAEARGFENIPPESEVRWSPSIHMPRWASRITLEITDVRVERLQEITDADIEAEGVEPAEGWMQFAHRKAFRDLWDSLNAERGYSFDSSPWVWVIDFRRLEASHAR